MPSDPNHEDLLYHLALRDEWEAAATAGETYRRSTLGSSLEDVGFIHCSFAHQVQRIADLVYCDRHDVLLLVIDPTRLDAELRVENLEGGDDPFPHIYGALPVDAVVRVEPVPVDADGRLEVGSLVAPE